MDNGDSELMYRSKQTIVKTLNKLLSLFKFSGQFKF